MVYESICPICHHEISNPICPDCLSNSIMFWAVNYPKLALSLNKPIKKHLEKNKDKEGIRCIKCNKYKVYECPYCFTEFIWQEIKDITNDKRLLHEYLTYFNFDTDHTGYWKEKELIEAQL